MNRMKTIVVLVGVAALVACGVFLASSTKRPAGVKNSEQMDRVVVPTGRAGSLDLPAVAPFPVVDASQRSNNRSPIRFTSMTEHSGIDMIYYGSPSPEHYMIEQNGGGVALFDYDNDGQLDVFLVNGSHFEKPAVIPAASNRLYQSTGAFRFQDVTAMSGLEAVGFGMGCACADFDNDGFTDLFVAYYGRNRIWHNNGDGTFDEITEQTGIGSDEWSCSAAFADFDGDGNLDLYVVNYVEWSQDDPVCYSHHQPPLRVSCSPMSRAGQVDRLYRNQGDGTFEEIGRKAGIAIRDSGKGLALAVADFDFDQRLDVYVANDTTPNSLFRNLGNMEFEDVAVIEGVAVSEDGAAGASMGIACGDYNQDGRLDLFVTNFENQVNDVFSNMGNGGFVTANWQLGLDSSSRAALAFGIVLADFDLDRSLDLFVANGHIWNFTAAAPQFEYEMLPSLYSNEAGKRFRDVTQSGGDYFRQKSVGRAAAAGDLDNDGDTDLVVTHLGKAPAILRNDSDRSGESVQLRLVGTQASRQPLGVQVDIWIQGEKIVTQIPSGGSFQSNHDVRVLVACGVERTISRITVYWSEKSIETWTDLTVDEEIVLIQGTGTRVVSD